MIAFHCAGSPCEKWLLVGGHDETDARGAAMRDESWTFAGSLPLCPQHTLHIPAPRDPVVMLVSLGRV